jgi:hypothetical protein
MTGIRDPAENYEGLDHAQTWWFERAAALGLAFPGA